MKLLESFDNWSYITEAETSLERFLDNVINENIGAILGSPIKYMKIKNVAKQYQTALVQKAINNLDFEKKKAAGTLAPKQKEVLVAANKQKNQALSDTLAAYSQKMDSLASTEGLKAIVSIAKNKSQLSAAEIALKTADGEEAKALKPKIQGLNKKVAASQEELEDYKKNGDDKQKVDGVKSKPKVKTPPKVEPKKAEPKAKEDSVKSKPEVKTPPKVEPKAKEDNVKSKPEVKTPPKVEPKKEEPKAKEDNVKSKPEVKTPPKVEPKKEEPKKEEPKKEEPKKEEPKSRELTDKENERLAKAEGILKKAKEAGDTAKIKKAEDLIKSIKDTKKLGESLDLDMIDEALKSIVAMNYITESIATRFKRAMDQRGPIY
jgi:hypothetical protein